jgi:hypothetical protein
MAVYVDNIFARYRSMLMCHLVADTKRELLTMVDKIGVDRKWIQAEGTPLEHFDICKSKRTLAIKHGAKEIEYGRELALIFKRKREGQNA